MAVTSRQNASRPTLAKVKEVPPVEDIDLSAGEYIDDDDDDDAEAHAPIEGSVASLLEQAQEEIEALRSQLEWAGGCAIDREKTIESLRDELAAMTAKEQALGALFGRLAELRCWTVSEGRETSFVLAADMVEAAQIAIEMGGTPDRVLLVPKALVWPSYLTKP